MINVINVGYLEENLDELVLKKVLLKENDDYSIDLGKIGYNKLLSQGSLKNKFKITVDEASKKAIEKVKKAGGEVILINKKTISKGQ